MRAVLRIRDPEYFFFWVPDPTKSFETVFRVKHTSVLCQLTQIFSCRYLLKKFSNLQFCEMFTFLLESAHFTVKLDEISIFDLKHFMYCCLLNPWSRIKELTQQCMQTDKKKKKLCVSSGAETVACKGMLLYRCETTRRRRSWPWWTRAAGSWRATWRRTRGRTPSYSTYTGPTPASRSNRSVALSHLCHIYIFWTP